jgi:Restriction endonuclease
MMGRADKGLIITTGTFTLEAKKEARRDGVPPIELVDGDILVDMFEKNLNWGSFRSGTSTSTRSSLKNIRSEHRIKNAVAGTVFLCDGVGRYVFGAAAVGASSTRMVLAHSAT